MMIFVMYSVRKWVTFREELFARVSLFLSVAFLGALAFSLMFYIPHFERAGDANWGVLGLSILTLPVFLACILGEKPSNLRRVFVIASAITMFSGTIMAFIYPIYDPTFINAIVANDLKQVAKKCDVEAILALDPNLGNDKNISVIASLLGRKNLFQYNGRLKPDDGTIGIMFKDFNPFLDTPCDSLYAKTDLPKRDYLILTGKRTETISFMQQHGFVIKEALECGAIVLKNNTLGKE